MATQLETLELLSKSETGALYLGKKDYEALAKKGFVEFNLDVTDPQNDNKCAVRIMPSGLAHLAKFNSDAPAAKPVSAFMIMDAPIPVTKRKGGAGRPSKYPFDSLAVGQMFFVPDSKEQLEPAKSLGSVVTSANKRYAVPVEGKTKVNRKGETVQAFDYTRKFIVRPFSVTNAEGDIVHGAGVWREK